ncbi:MAG: rod shape-determining protein MreD [Burkholderiales bacterium]|nr:rod shape-determining protein MreD [Nitrosomonadaceae bacterium]
MDLSPLSADPLRPPAPMRLVLGSLLVALLLNLLPWSGWALLLKPDFLLLVVLYWAVHESRSVGQTWGFAFGLLMDVADSALLGQHALVYVVAIFLTQQLRIRMLHLRLFEQALHVAGILFVAQLIYIGLNLSLGRDFAGLALLFGPAVGALLWTPLHAIAVLPRFRRRGETVML